MSVEGQGRGVGGESWDDLCPATFPLLSTGITEAHYIDCFQKIKYSFNLLVCGSPQVPQPFPPPHLSSPLLSFLMDIPSFSSFSPLLGLLGKCQAPHQGPEQWGPGVLVKVGWEEGW